MKANEDNHFETAKTDFSNLKLNKEIPPQMQSKLDYLLSKILSIPIPKELLEQLPEYELHSLDQLNVETGTHLFCNIVNCLTGKEIVLYFRDEKAYMRKDEMLSIWKVCYITCDSQSVMIRKKINEKVTDRFEIEKLRVSKNFKLHKKKFVFGACYNQKKQYLIGFDIESVCSRVHELLRGIIREKVRRMTSKLEIKPVQESMSELSVSRCLENMEEHEKDDEEEEEVDEESDKGVIIQYILGNEVSGNSFYHLIKTSNGNLRVLQHKNYPNKLKWELLSERPKQTSSIFDSYLRMDEWNPEIESIKIKTKVDENSYIISIRIKKYSYMSWPRSAIILATALVYDNRYFLVLRSTGEEVEDKDTVKMEWNQILEICEDLDRGKVLITICNEFDFKGYSSLDDSHTMTLKSFNVELFEKFLEARLIDSKGTSLFNLKLNEKKKKKITKEKSSKTEASEVEFEPSSPSKSSKIRKLSTNSEFSVPDNISKEDHSEQNNEETEKKIETKETNVVEDPSELTIYMMKDKESEISPKLIELVEKKLFEKYYLKQHFDQEVHLDVSRNEYSVTEPNHYIFQNSSWKVNENEDVIFVNQKEIDIQKDIIKMIIKQLGSNIMSGKSIMSMSLPVEIFDSRSMLERIAMGFSFAPKFLVPASETEDLVEQMKFVTLFGMGVNSLHLALAKPFNPILGETFECRIGGIPCYFEQICHHPPISYFYMKGENFTFYGAFNTHGDMGLNRFTGRNLAPLFMEFTKTKTFYELKLPDIEISGLTYGQRKARANGYGFIHERTNNLFSEWNIGKDKKKVYTAEKKLKEVDVCGGIFTTTETFGKKFKSCENKQKFEGIKIDEIVESHVKITGHWCFDIFFDGTKVKSIENPIPNKMEYPQYVLPSDANFRLDLLYKRLDNNQLANENKEIMENIQRRDKKLREGKIKL